jgi:hypothetical protein
VPIVAPHPGKANIPHSLEEELKILDAQIKASKDFITRATAQLEALKKAAKKDKKHAKTAQIAALEAQLKRGQATLGGLNTKRADAQNRLYEKNGEYEKLLSGTDRDAFMAINALFKTYGIESLAPKIYDYVKNGYSADTISILLQDSPEYKARFSGNEARKAAGLPVLSAGEYLATEASFRQIMQSAGLPSGFYDQPTDFTTWIGKNVSPSEIQSRVDLATQATVLANPNYRKALNQLGISDSELTAYFLDPNKALPYLQKSAATAAIGGQALSQGLTFDKSYSEQLALEGISNDQAQQGYSQIASELDTMKALGQIYGDQWTQRSSEQAVFEGNSTALNKQKKLLSQERGAFSGASGGSRGGLAQSGGAR